MDDFGLDDLALEGQDTEADALNDDTFGGDNDGIFYLQIILTSSSSSE